MLRGDLSRMKFSMKSIFCSYIYVCIYIYMLPPLGYLPVLGGYDRIGPLPGLRRIPV